MAKLQRYTNGTPRPTPLPASECEAWLDELREIWYWFELLGDASDLTDKLEAGVSKPN